MLYGDPEQMENWSSRPRLAAFRLRCPIEMSRGGTPKAISSESSAERHFTAPRNDDGLFQKQASVNAEPTSSSAKLEDPANRPNTKVAPRPGGPSFGDSIARLELPVTRMPRPTVTRSAAPA